MNCRHRIWICSPSIATAIAANVITAAGATIVRDGLFVTVIVVVAISLLFNFCLGVCSIGVIISMGTNSETGFRIWIPKLELRGLFIYDTITNRADLIKMIQIQTKTHKHQISEFLAIAAMTLLLIHIVDGSVERFSKSKHGFLPVSIDKKPFRISNFGISSIILFFLAFGIDIRGKNTSKLTTTLLIVGGAIIGTSALGASVIDKTGLVATLLTVIVIGYIIIGSGMLRVIQQRRTTSKIV